MRRRRFYGKAGGSGTQNVKQRQIPGSVYINQTKTTQAHVPGGAFVNGV